MVGIEKRESTYDSGFQTDDELENKYIEIFSQLRKEALSDIRAAGIIRQQADRLIYSLENV